VRYDAWFKSTSRKELNRLKAGKALQQRCLSNPVITEKDGPLPGTAVTIGQIQRLPWTEAADVLYGKRQEIDRWRSLRFV
jgi:hypothetical protein